MPSEMFRRHFVVLETAVFNHPLDKPCRIRFYSGLNLNQYGVASP
ncbi:TPA: hypothetical protein ACXH4S_000081 [Neisseria meningitidis]|nr:hypothetical protein [Neisseria meningitidis]